MSLGALRPLPPDMKFNGEINHLAESDCEVIRHTPVVDVYKFHLHEHYIPAGGDPI